ncbi:MAG TPA: enoyl-CoA hydratase-related protein [Acidimicrobiia bacterium]
MNLRIADADGVRLLTLDRPEVLNAFDTALYLACADALTEAAGRDDVAVVVITGEGRAFSAGQDLAEMAALGNPAAADAGAAHGFPAFVDAVMAFPKPLLAAVNGIGIGIGLTLLPHCDLVLIADTARLRGPFVPLGVVPEAAASVTLPAVMGNQRAAHLLFTGAWIDADEAVASGLAWRRCPPDQLLDETMGLAREIAAFPLESLVATKRLLGAGRVDALRAARSREDAEFARLTGAAANREALASFLGKGNA